MKNKGDLLLRIAVFVSIIIFVLIFCFSCHSIRHGSIETDCENLRNVVAEAYINISKDPKFVNTATRGHPMEIPEKYYTLVESSQGDGRVHVVIYYDGTLDSYFGTPEKNLNYYLGYQLYELPE